MTKFISESDSGKLPAPSRRHWLLAALGGVSALGGVGLAWQRFRSAESESKAANLDIWKLEFPTPQGGILRLVSFRGKPVVINFWATWCPPCIDELPLLSDFYQKKSANGWQVLGLAVDQLEPVKHFLAQSPVSFAVALAGMPGIELSRTLGNLSGGLPFTVVLGSDGLVAHRKIGRLSPDDLLSWSKLI